MNQVSPLELPSPLDGLWVLLVAPGQDLPPMEASDGRIPMMARAGDEQTYLLGFKNAANARKFLKDSELGEAEPRLVVRANRNQLLSTARANGAVGVLVDYDPATRAYSAAAAL